MSEFELFYDMGGEYGDGITLNKHGDRYSLVRAKKSKKAEGTIYLEWCFPQDRDRKPRSPRSLPRHPRRKTISPSEVTRWDTQSKRFTKFITIN